jgi:hypothetical protein
MNTPVIRPRIIVEAPTADIQPGRGFYQLEEDALSRLDFDRTGKLIFIELMVPRRQWTVWQDFRVPEHARPAVLRWVDFRKPLKPPQLFTDPHRLHLCMEFGGDDGDEVYRIAGSVLVETYRQKEVRRLWISDIVDDLAGQEIAAFRKYISRRS